LFADTGLGKTAMQLAWAHQVVRRTGGRVLILAPLAIGPQTVREAAKFGIPGVKHVRQGDQVEDGITVCNYQSLHKLEPHSFAGVVLDESSILKAYSGATKQALVDAFAETPFRLACTATPAPNDYLELGNHSEFLGVMPSHQMLARWFVNDQSGMCAYRLKGHAVTPFWDWVTSWARCIGRPSDMGAYSDAGFDLPPFRLHRHSVTVDLSAKREEGMLFRLQDGSATSLHRERRLTSEDRAAKVAELVRSEPDESWLIWTDTNYDADALRAILPEATEVRGDHSDDEKEARLLGFADGSARVLVTKPSIAGFGLNWQHCARVAFVGPSYSYEQFYQAIRRCWRFGQTRQVEVHVVLAATEALVGQVLDHKGEAHEAMKIAMFAASRRAASRAARSPDYLPIHKASVPRWLRSE
jgi:superfamily II DNA or RNA helicase